MVHELTNRTSDVGAKRDAEEYTFFYGLGAMIREPRRDQISDNSGYGGGGIPLPAAAFDVLRHPLLGAPQVKAVARIKHPRGGTQGKSLKSSNQKC